MIHKVKYKHGNHVIKCNYTLAKREMGFRNVKTMFLVTHFVFFCFAGLDVKSFKESPSLISKNFGFFVSSSSPVFFFCKLKMNGYMFIMLSHYKKISWDKNQLSNGSEVAIHHIDGQYKQLNS